MVPVVDLLGQPILDRGPRLLDEGQTARADFFEVFGHHVLDGMGMGPLLQRGGDPGRLRPGQDLGHAGLVGRQRPVVQVGRVVHVVRASPGVQLQVEQALGDDPARSGGGQAGVLDRVLQVEQHPGRGTRVSLVDQDGAPAEQVAVALEGQVQGGVEERMARVDEGGQGLTLKGHQPLLEGDPLVPRQDRVAGADEPVAVKGLVVVGLVLDALELLLEGFLHVLGQRHKDQLKPLKSRYLDLP